MCPRVMIGRGIATRPLGKNFSPSRCFFLYEQKSIRSKYREKTTGLTDYTSRCLLVDLREFIAGMPVLLPKNRLSSRILQAP